MLVGSCFLHPLMANVLPPPSQACLPVARVRLNLVRAAYSGAGVRNVFVIPYIPDRTAATNSVSAQKSTDGKQLPPLLRKIGPIFFPWSKRLSLSPKGSLVGFVLCGTRTTGTAREGKARRPRALVPARPGLVQPPPIPSFHQCTSFVGFFLDTHYLSPLICLDFLGRVFPFFTPLQNSLAMFPFFYYSNCHRMKT